MYEFHGYGVGKNFGLKEWRRKVQWERCELTMYVVITDKFYELTVALVSV